VIGHDTESLVTGYAFLVTNSLGDYVWIHSPEDVVRYLSSHKHTKTFNTLWNMDFDVSVLLKWLGKDFCKQLITYGCAYYGTVYFEYVSKRFLIVRDGKVWNTYFDASQYYIPRSLDGASKVYLNKAKISIGRKEFYGSDYGSAKILEYCIYDSKLCAELTQLLLCDLHDMGFEPATLSSPGTVMEEALVGAVYLPDVTKIPREALEYAYHSYKGGWMECFKRGYFPKLWDYDISSAYPYQVARLLDLNGGVWQFKKGKIPPSTLGFVKCYVDITSDISPIIYQADINFTPKGSWLTNLTLDEVEFIRAHELGSVEVIDGWYFNPAQDATNPFRYSMRRLFRQKSQIKNRWLPKALSVALYGKFAQRYEDGETGNLFNPIYASIITARTRLQIAEYALMLPKALAVITTDGLTFNAPLPRSVLSDKFGGLRLSHSDEGVVIGTNVYTIKGKYPGGAWRPGRFDWLYLLNKHSTKKVFSLKHLRPVTLREGVVPDFKHWDEVGVFKEFPYDFNLNFDHKRLYQKVSCARELMEGQFECLPWEVSIPQRRKELWELK